MSTLLKPLAVFGLGYVGLPLSLCYCIKHHKVYGIDISKKLVNELKSGVTHLVESHNGKAIVKILGENLESGNFIPTAETSEAFRVCDKYVITVGIPVYGDNLYLDPIQNVCATISEGLKKGDTVIVRSTVPPGTTEEVLVPILEKSGLKAGEDFYLAYCPERISEGNAFDEFENIPVVISGINEESIKKGKKIIGMISSVEPVVVSDIRIAELAKVIENVQRDVNIAMVQQIANICRNSGIDIFELIKAVNTHPRVNLLKPGPGVGGYCIPNALHYLKPAADKTGADISLLALSRKINSEVPQMVAGQIKAYLKENGKAYAEAKVAVLGAAMKDHCGDIRQSPVIDIVTELIKSGISVAAYDPYVKGNFVSRTEDLAQCLDKADCLLVAAVQHGMDFNNFELLRASMNDKPMIFDTRNVINREKAKEFGFVVKSI